MTDPEKFKKYLGKEKYYQDFLVFFQNEMESKGWEEVVQEYLFEGTESADDLLGRLYAGQSSFMPYSGWYENIVMLIQLKVSCIRSSSLVSGSNSSNRLS